MMTGAEITRPQAFLVTESGDGLPELPKAETTDGKTVFIVVSLTGGPQEKIEMLEQCHGEPPDEVHVVSATGTPVGVDGVDSVSEVGRPGDLTGLSMKIGSALSDAHEENVYLYFDDITSLLQFVDLRKAFRFFNALTGRLYSANGVGYFEMTPGAHDEQTTATIVTLFDETVGGLDV